jgi:hypothetical protein
VNSDNKEWSFTEINGCEKYYYFKCSTHKSNVFGKIFRSDGNKDFILT